MALSGHNIRAVVTLCRWASLAGVALHLVGAGRDDPIQLTSHRDRVFLQRSSTRLDLSEVTSWIETLRRTHGYDRVVIAPSTEYFNRFLLRWRPEIERVGGFIPLVDEALYADFSDKEKFSRLCQLNGIPVPEVFDQLPDVPFVAKPRSYLSTRGEQIKPILVMDERSRDEFVSSASREDFFFQSFVEGRSVYLLAHVARSGEIVVTAQKNLMQQTGGGSIILAVEDDFHRSPAARPYLELLRSTGFFGLVMVEVRLCSRTGRAVMIEANPRMWGPQQFAMDRGVDLLKPLFTDCGVDVLDFHLRNESRKYYFWSGGLFGRGECVFHDFSPGEFSVNYKDIVRDDLFDRNDTISLYRHERCRHLI